MKKNKEEWKKQLDAHFQDIERYPSPHPGKSNPASSTSPPKPNAPTTPSSPSSTSSTIKSKKPEMTSTTTSSHSPTTLTKNSNSKTRKWPTSARTSQNRPKIATASSRRGSARPGKDSRVLLWRYRNKRGDREGEGGANVEREVEHGKDERIAVPAEGAAEGGARRTQHEDKVARKEHKPRTVLAAQVQRMYRPLTQNSTTRHSTTSKTAWALCARRWRRGSTPRTRSSTRSPRWSRPCRTPSGTPCDAVYQTYNA